MDDLLTVPVERRETRYLRASTIKQRYGFSTATFYRLRHHPNPLKRFPRPAMILGTYPLWAESDLIAYEKAHSTEPA